MRAISQTRGGLVRIVAAALVAVIFATAAVAGNTGTGPFYAYETLYYENLTRREITRVQQRLRLDEPAAAIVATSLQEDGWSNEPMLESPVPIRDGALNTAASTNGEWLEAAGTGVLATTVSMAIFYLGGVRFDWA